MEDVLEVYQRPHDPACPVVCVDETSKQLIAETRAPIPAKPGRPVRHDYEYLRNGTANLFMMFAPLEGWRHVKCTDRHTAVDYAQVLKELSDIHFPQAAKIVLVQDNLNTHKPASLYEAFPAAEARRLVERFEWHYTPKHGSWLDMAECELSVLSAQCLDRRIADKQTLIDEVDAWQYRRNKHHTKADWQFTTADARVKLKRLYPFRSAPPLCADAERPRDEFCRASGGRRRIGGRYRAGHVTPFDELHHALRYHIVNTLGWTDLHTTQRDAIRPILAGENAQCARVRHALIACRRVPSVALGMPTVNRCTT